MPGRWGPVAASAVAILAAAVSAAAPGYAQEGQGSLPPFTVLQAAFHPLAATAATEQGAQARAVLLEQAVAPDGDPAGYQRNASQALLGATGRWQLVVANYHAPLGTNPLAAPTAASRMGQYYQADRLPTSIFDGVRRIVAFAPDSPQTFEGAYQAAAGVPAGASIRANGSVVLQHGFLDAQATATTDVSSAAVYLRAVLVEDPVASEGGTGDLRFVVRQWLGSLRLAEGGHASGRFNFTLDASWIASRLGAVLFVQSDGPRQGSPPPAGGQGPGWLEAVLVPYAPYLMLVALLALGAALVGRERRKDAKPFSRRRGLERNHGRLAPREPR